LHWIYICTVGDGGVAPGTPNLGSWLRCLREIALSPHWLAGWFDLGFGMNFTSEREESFPTRGNELQLFFRLGYTLVFILD